MPRTDVAVQEHSGGGIAREGLQRFLRHLRAGRRRSMGINRGPSAAYAVLLRLGWDPVEAIDLIRTKRPIAAVGYAEDALDWWHRRSGATPEKRVDDVERLARWRRRHPHDTVRIIRSIREGGSAA